MGGNRDTRGRTTGRNLAASWLIDSLESRLNARAHIFKNYFRSFYGIF